MVASSDTFLSCRVLLESFHLHLLPRLIVRFSLGEIGKRKSLTESKIEVVLRLDLPQPVRTSDQGAHAHKRDLISMDKCTASKYPDRANCSRSCK